VDNSPTPLVVPVDDPPLPMGGICRIKRGDGCFVLIGVLLALALEYYWIAVRDISLRWVKSQAGSVRGVSFVGHLLHEWILVKRWVCGRDEANDVNTCAGTLKRKR
jgi:hypothetical protein